MASSAVGSLLDSGYGAGVGFELTTSGSAGEGDVPSVWDKPTLTAKSLLEGLDSLHEKGVYHRDIKGANIIISDTGKVEIVDFGIAVEASGGRNFQAQFGTRGYMSSLAYREEALGIEDLNRHDIWAAVVTIQAGLIGAIPYHGRSIDHTFGRPYPSARVADGYQAFFDLTQTYLLEFETAAKSGYWHAAEARLEEIKKYLVKLSQHFYLLNFQ